LATGTAPTSLMFAGSRTSKNWMQPVTCICDRQLAVTE
jgi:hypothetical protein